MISWALILSLLLIIAIAIIAYEAFILRKATRALIDMTEKHYAMKAIKERLVADNKRLRKAIEVLCDPEKEPYKLPGMY